MQTGQNVTEKYQSQITLTKEVTVSDTYLVIR